MTDPSGKELEQAREWMKSKRWVSHLHGRRLSDYKTKETYELLAEYRAAGVQEARQEAERETFEKCCAAICSGCKEGNLYKKEGWHTRQSPLLGLWKCLAKPIRSAFPHLAPQEKK